MKRHIPLFALVLIMLVTMGFTYMPHGIIRLHVIANSDSSQDQRVKLLVRDEVLRTLSGLGEVVDEGLAREKLLAQAETLQRNIEQRLSSEGMGYGATLYFGEYPFPERTYGDVTYPAGDYTALRVVLGDGGGRNWWCVLFPPLCLVDTSAQKKGKPVKFHSVVLDLLKSK